MPPELTGNDIAHTLETATQSPEGVEQKQLNPDAVAAKLNRMLDDVAAKSPEFKDKLANDPQLAEQARDFLLKAATNRLTGPLDRYNADASDKNSDHQLGPEELGAFCATLDTALTNIVKIGDFDRFTSASGEIKAWVESTSVTRGVEKLTGGKTLVGAGAEAVTNLSPAEQEKLYNAKPGDPDFWKGIALRIGTTFPAMAEELGKLAADALPPIGVVTIGAFMKYKIGANFGTEASRAESEMKLDALAATHPLAGLLQLVSSEKGWGAVKQMGEGLWPPTAKNIVDVVAIAATLGVGLSRLGGKAAAMGSEVAGGAGGRAVAVAERAGAAVEQTTARGTAAVAGNEGAAGAVSTERAIAAAASERAGAAGAEAGADAGAAGARAGAAGVEASGGTIDVASAARQFEGELRELQNAKNILAKSEAGSRRAEIFAQQVAKRTEDLAKQGVNVEEALAHLAKRQMAAEASAGTATSTASMETSSSAAFQTVESSGRRAAATTEQAATGAEGGRAVALTEKAGESTSRLTVDNIAGQQIRWQTTKGEIFEGQVTRLENGNFQINIPGKPSFGQTAEEMTQAINGGRVGMAERASAAATETAETLVVRESQALVRTATETRALTQGIDELVASGALDVAEATAIRTELMAATRKVGELMSSGGRALAERGGATIRLARAELEAARARAALAFERAAARGGQAAETAGRWGKRAAGVAALAVGAAVWPSFDSEGGAAIAAENLMQSTKPPPAPPVAPPAAAEATTELPKEVVVAKGESLWKIAARELGSGTRWKEIYDANRDVIGANPDLILPGQKLQIPKRRAA